MFIEIDDKLINLDNVTDIFKTGKCIRICFHVDSIEVKRESEEELNMTWEWLRGVVLIRAGGQE